MKEKTVDRTPGWSVRLKLTLSYAGFLMIAGGLLLGAVWIFLLRYVPRGETVIVHNTHVLVHPGRGALLRDFAPAAAILVIFLLVFGLLGGWLLAGRMLAPLARITDAARTTGTGSLSHRIGLPGRKDEFRELADAFDAMLARLEAHSVEQQRFVANASHELRTPLAITQALLDVAGNDPNREDNELDERLRAVNARAIGLTEALLLLSRADQEPFTPVPVDLSLIAGEATETLLPFAEKHGVAIETSGDVTPAIGSESLLLQMTMNLVHNAIVHNLPERGTVCVTTSVHPETVMLTVVNTGENLTPQVVTTLTEPFRRGAERMRTDDGGVGLGLAIVKSIVQAHDGTLTLTPRPTGGLCVTVQLPFASTHPDEMAARGTDTATEQRGSRATLRPFRVPDPVWNQKLPSSQSAPKAVTCGLPSSFTVESHVERALRASRAGGDPVSSFSRTFAQFTRGNPSFAPKLMMSITYPFW
jgi:two-component system sensor histidine kinase VanS